MSLRPVDMQMPVQRSADAIQASNNAAHRPEYQRQWFAERLRREAEHNERHVRKSNKPEEETIDREERGRSKHESNRENKEKEKKKAALAAFMGGSLLDIRV
ncbi:MAG: hypothetical protein LBB94_11530 [Clostridiales bacterium]|jgi:hypothetical protein|nr:hypothetical protein [Clostridiales bacterium]